MRKLIVLLTLIAAIVLGGVTLGYANFATPDPMPIEVVTPDFVDPVEELNKEVKTLKEKVEKQAKQIKTLKTKNKKLKARIKKMTGVKATLKATWYTGKGTNTRGAFGKLTSGKSIALNDGQRKKLGIKKGGKVYLKFGGKFKSMSGYYDVLDCGCRSGIVDVYYVNRGAVPAAFRRQGVINNVKLYKHKP